MGCPLLLRKMGSEISAPASLLIAISEPVICCLTLSHSLRNRRPLGVRKL